MADNKWLGAAQPRVAIAAFIPTNVSPGSSWVLRVGASNFQYVFSSSVAENATTPQDRAMAVCLGLAGAYAGAGFGGGADGAIGSITAEIYGGMWSIMARGSSDGAPLDINVVGSEAEGSVVRVMELQAGSAAANDTQLIRWPKTPSGGGLTLTYKDKTTDTLKRWELNAPEAGVTITGGASYTGGRVKLTANNSPLTSMVEFAINEPVPVDITIAAEINGGSVGLLELMLGATVKGNFVTGKTLVLTVPAGPQTVRVRFQAPTEYGTQDAWVYYGAYQVPAIPYNASAGAVQSALQALSTIGAGNALVTGSAADGYVVQFAGALAGKPAELISAYSADAVGTAVAQYEVVTRGGYTNSTYVLAKLSGDSEQIYAFTYGRQRSHYFTAATTTEGIKHAVESIPAQAGNVSVVRNADGSTTIAINSDNSVGEGETLEIDTSAARDTPTLTGTAGSVTPESTVEKLNILNRPNHDRGTITLDFKGASTGPLAINGLTASTVSWAFANSGIPWECTAATVEPNQAIVLEFTSLAKHDTGLVTCSFSLTGCYAVSVNRIAEAVAAANSIQQIALLSGPDGGTFTLSFGGDTTSNIAYNAAAGTVQTALLALGSIDAGNIEVQGNNGGPWLALFKGSKAGLPQALITGNGANLTIISAAAVTTEEVQKATGPGWWTDPRNWSLGTVPTGSDTAIFQTGATACQHGIEDVTAPGGIDVYRSYKGRIGMPEMRDDGSTETRPTALSIGGTGAKINVRIGLGDEGDGPSLIRFDSQLWPVDVNLMFSTSSDASELYTVGLAGEINAIAVGGASLKIGESRSPAGTSVETLRFSPPEPGSEVAVIEWSEAVAVDYVEMSAGTLRAGSVPKVLVLHAGACSIRGSGDIDQLSVRNARLRYRATGKIGRQGVVTVLGSDAKTQLVLTSAAHGLASGDLVFVRGVKGLPDRYHVIDVLTTNTFALVGSDSTGVAGGSAAGAQWGLADAVRIGSGGELDFSEQAELRYVVAPFILQAPDAVLRDPLITIADLRWHSDPGFMDADFGGQGVFKREQSIAVSYSTASHIGGGGGLVGG